MFRYVKRLAAAAALCASTFNCVSWGDSASGATLQPLFNPSAELGASGWVHLHGGTTPPSIATGPVSIGSTTFSATDGSNWFMGEKSSYTTSSPGISYGVLSFKQAVDVSQFAAIESVTFGGDAFARGLITSGSGTIMYQHSAKGGCNLSYLDSGGVSVGSTYLEFDDGDDVEVSTSPFFADDIRFTDTTIPSGISQIEFRVFNSFVIGTSGGGPVTADLLVGVDDLYLSVTGALVPEPSTFCLAGVGLLTLALFGRRRRRA